METRNIYQDTMQQLQEIFQEEAASFLTSEQIEQILQKEKEKITFSEQKQISLMSWMGNNLRRYSKDLLRRQQPFFALYYLLNVCTEASIVLFLCYGIYSLIHSGFPTLSFSIIPGIILVWFCGQEWNRHYTRRCIQDQCVPKQGYKILHMIIPALLISLVSVLLWHNLLHLYHTFHLQNTFLTCAVFLFLSGIHNVLYSSHAINFITIGILRCSRRSTEPEIQTFIAKYLDRRITVILAEQKKTRTQMQSDPKLYADIHMMIRSHLVTYRVYLLFALFILTAFDILCIYQTFQTHAVSMLLLGSATALVIAILITYVISCNEIIRSLTKH